MSDCTSDFDSAWKETIEGFFRPFMELLFFDLALRIDWSKGFQFLNNELQSTVLDSKPAKPSQAGRQYVDKLVRVHLDGHLQWILLHIEIQSQADSHFPWRMFRYFYRILEVHELPILSVAVLADPDAGYRPGPFTLETAGSGCVFRYHSCKLLDLDESMLRQSSNPVAKVILAHRIAQRTAKDPGNRLNLKLEWFQELFRHGFSRKEIRRLLLVLDAMTPLPRDLAVEFRNQIIQSDPHKIMPYITSFERIAREEALQEGLSKGLSEGLSQGMSQGRSEGQLDTLRESIQDLLEERFGAAPEKLIDRLGSESDPTVLRTWLRRAATIESIDAFRILLVD